MISILIVENNPLLRASYKKAFNSSFSENTYVDIVHDGDEAITKVKAKQGNGYDFIVLQVGMSSSDPFEFAKKIKALGFRKAILAHSSLGIQSVQHAIIDGTIDGFVFKTEDAKKLIHVIQRHASA